MLSKEFEETLNKRIKTLQSRLDKGKEQYSLTLKSLRFIKKHHYLKLRCKICEKNFICTGFCLLDSSKFADSGGCICGRCDTATLDWRKKCRKGNSLFQVFAQFAEQERLKRKGNAK